MYYFVVLMIMCMLQVRGDPVTSIECDCGGTSMDSDPSACCVIEWPILSPSVAVSFRNVPNTSSVIQIKLNSSSNLTEIPSQIIDTFGELEYLEITIGLNQLPLSRVPSKLKHLNLGYNRITTIDTDAFRNAPNLEQINLQYNQIGTVAERDAFAGPANLKHLILYHNKLRALKRQMFTAATQLQSLDVGCNEIETIDDGTFDLPHLREILMSENKIKVLSDIVFHGAPNVQNIDLQKNMLERIGKAFDTTVHLHQLQLAENDQLQDLNVVDLVSKLPELISLSVDSTGIRSIGSTTITPATQLPLHTLSISHNHLTQSDFLKQLAPFSKLEKVFVDANKFVRWDESDVKNVKKYFPNMELIVTEKNLWDRKWVESTLIPVFQSNNIFCSNLKYLNTYIEGSTNSIDGQIIEGTECI